MKFPFVVQDSCSNPERKRSIYQRQARRHRVPSWDTCFKYLLLVRKSKNIHHNPEKYTDDWFFWKEACFPLNFFKRLLFHFNSEQSLDIFLLFSSLLFKPKFYFPAKSNSNSLFPTLCHLSCVAKINIWEMDAALYTGATSTST